METRIDQNVSQSCTTKAPIESTDLALSTEQTLYCPKRILINAWASQKAINQFMCQSGGEGRLGIGKKAWNFCFFCVVKRRTRVGGPLYTRLLFARSRPQTDFHYGVRSWQFGLQPWLSLWRLRVFGVQSYMVSYIVYCSVCSTHIRHNTSRLLVFVVVIEYWWEPRVLATYANTATS